MSMIKAPLIFAGNSQNIIVPLLINKLAIRTPLGYVLDKLEMLRFIG